MAAVADGDLLSAVLAQPDDDSLRIVYADQLEERGELARATLIRMECALASVPPYDARWLQHWQWLAEHRGALGLPSLPSGVEWPPLATERGLPSRLRVNDVDTFLTHAAAIFAAAPIRHLHIDARANPFPLARFLASPLLARITSLQFQLGRFGADAIEMLENAESVQHLEQLSFEFEGIVDGGLHHLVRSPLAQRLSRLGLYDNFFLNHGSSLTRAFHDAPSLPALRQLELGRNRLDAEVLRVVLAVVGNLTALELHDNPLGDDGFRLLAESPSLLHLTNLGLDKTGPRLAGVRALSSAGGLPALRSLSLRHNRLGPTSARALAGATLGSELRFLDLSGNVLGDAGVALIIASPSFPSLERADLRDNQLGPETAARAQGWFLETQRR